MRDFKTLATSSFGPIFLTPRSPYAEAGPMHAVFFNAKGVEEVVSEGTNPEDGVFRFQERGSLSIVLTLETGWRLFVAFKSDEAIEFDWSSAIFGDDTGESGKAQFDSALGLYYFATPAVSGSIPPDAPPSVVTIRAGSITAAWTIRALQLTALS